MPYLQISKQRCSKSIAFDVHRRLLPFVAFAAIRTASRKVANSTANGFNGIVNKFSFLTVCPVEFAVITAMPHDGSGKPVTIAGR